MEDLVQNFLDEILKGIDKEKLSAEDEVELSKFRENLAACVQKIIIYEGEDKKKIVRAMKIGAISLITQFPVVIPYITAMIHAIAYER